MISDVQYRESLRVISDLNSKIDVFARENAVLRGHEKTIANHVRTIDELQNQVAGRNVDVVALNKSVGDKDKLIASLQAEKSAALGETSRLFGVIILYQDSLRAAENKKSLVDAEVVRLNKVIGTKNADIAALIKAKTEVENALWWSNKRCAELTALYKILRDEHDYCLPLFKMTCIITGRGKIEGGHSYPANMNVVIAAVPKAGWVLAYAGFTFDGRAVETPYKFVMPNHDVIVTALFVYMGDGRDDDELDRGTYLITEVYEEVLLTERGVALLVERPEEEDEEGEEEEEKKNNNDVALLTEDGRLLVVEDSEGGDVGDEEERAVNKDAALLTEDGRLLIVEDRNGVAVTEEVVYVLTAENGDQIITETEDVLHL